MTDQNYLTIGELARRVGVTVRTIQYYDQQGLLSPSAKGPQNQRLYTDDNVKDLYRILTLKYLGLSLAQIKSDAALYREPAALQELADEQMDAIEEQFQSLFKRMTTLRSLHDESLDDASVNWEAMADTIERCQGESQFFWRLTCIRDDAPASEEAAENQVARGESVSKWHELIADTIRLMPAGEPVDSERNRELAKRYLELDMEQDTARAEQNFILMENIAPHAGGDGSFDELRQGVPQNLISPTSLCGSRTARHTLVRFQQAWRRQKAKPQPRKDTPMLVSWMTTNKCNLKCVHCYQDAEEATDKELSCEEGKKMIDEIARAGFKVMIFSGGEPLMRPDIYELVAHAASRGLRPVFGSNGTLITPEVAVRLKEAGACAMGISVDSLDAVKHDRFRGLEHAYDLTMAGIEACKQAGLPFQLHTTVVDWNRDEVCDITDFAVEIGAMAHYVFFLIPVGRGKFIQETSLEVLENEQLLKDIMTKASQVPIDVKPTCAPQFTRVAKQLGVDTRFERGCLAGLTYCVIGSEGIVRPCAYMTEEAGDVRETPFDEIWASSPVFEKLRTQAYSGSCGTCDYAQGCGGCRARAAYYHDGDILAQDDYCAHGNALVAAAV